MKKSIKTLILMAVMSVMMFAMTTIVSAESTINVPTLYYGNEAAVTGTYSYTNNNKLPNNYEYGTVIPLSVNEAGTIKLDLKFIKLEKSVMAEVYTDAACTNSIKYINYFTVGDTSKEVYIPVSSAGTYYIKFESSVYGTAPEFTNSFTISVSEYTMSDKTIKSGQTIVKL